MLKLAINFILMYSLAVHSSYAKTWEYIDLMAPSNLFVISNNPPMFGMNDVDLEAVICANDDEYICIVADTFEFYVPRKLGKNNLEWSKGKYKYKATLSPRLKIMGVYDEIYSIESDVNGNRVIYIFSKAHGLVGMGGNHAGNSRVFISASKCGFGAKSNCSE